MIDNTIIETDSTQSDSVEISTQTQDQPAGKILQFNPSKNKYAMREKLIQLKVQALRTSQKISNTELAIQAGYAPKSAPFIVSKILSLPETKEKIEKALIKLRITDEYVSTWTLARSIETAEERFKELSKKQDAASQTVAFKYKENLDKLSRLLVDKSEIVERVVYREIAQLPDEDLEKLARMRQN